MPFSHTMDEVGENGIFTHMVDENANFTHVHIHTHTHTHTNEHKLALCLFLSLSLSLFSAFTLDDTVKYAPPCEVSTVNNK